MEIVRDFILGGSQITADGDCSHEIKTHLLLGSKAMANLDSRDKSWGVILPTKVCLVKAMVFPVVMYGCDSWTIKKAECWRIDAFELWCWRRLLRVPWTARRSNRSILKEISPEYSLEGLMLKLKLPASESFLMSQHFSSGGQYFSFSFSFSFSISPSDEYSVRINFLQDWLVWSPCSPLPSHFSRVRLCVTP